MKTLRIIAASLAVFAMVACNNTPKALVNKDGSLNVEALKPSKGMVDSVSYLLGVNFGSMIKGYNMGEMNYSEIQKGINDFVKSEGNPSDSNFLKQFKISPELMNQLINDFIQKRSTYTGAVNKEEARKFFEANKTKAGVQVDTTSGLQYIIVEPGNDNKPSGKDTVYVHYTGTTLDGKVFDSNMDKKESAALTLNQVIKGWSEGMKVIGEGGKVKLFIPADLGYGDRGAGQDIQPGAALIFDVQLDSVKHFVDKTATK